MQLSELNPLTLQLPLQQAYLLSQHDIVILQTRNLNRRPVKDKQEQQPGDNQQNQGGIVNSKHPRKPVQGCFGQAQAQQQAQAVEASAEQADAAMELLNQAVDSAEEAIAADLKARAEADADEAEALETARKQAGDAVVSVQAASDAIAAKVPGPHSVGEACLR